MRTRKWLRLEPMEPTLGGRRFRAWMVAFFLGVAAVSLLVTWAFPRQDRLAAERQERLVTTAGTVSRTDVRAYDERRRGQGRRTWWEVEVWYTFEAEGRQRVGVNASFSDRETEFTTESEAVAFAARHPAGSVVTVWFDPADPSDSALDPSYTPVAFLVPWALGIGSVAAALGTWVARRTVYLQGDLEVSFNPITPEVRYYFRPDPAHPTVFVNGESWRFGWTDVGSEEEAQAVVARIGEDYRADRLVVHFDPREPTFSALSREYGSVVSTRTVSAAALALCLSVVALLRLRPAMARLGDGTAAPSTTSDW